MVKLENLVFSKNEKHIAKSNLFSYYMSDELYYVNCIDSNENVFVVSKIKHGEPYVEVNINCPKKTKGGKRKTQKRKYNK